MTGGSSITGNLVHRGRASATGKFRCERIVGDIFADATNTDVELQSGSSFDGRFSWTTPGSTSDLTLVNSTWKMTGNSIVTNLTTT